MTRIFVTQKSSKRKGVILAGNGAQTVFPGSILESGEAIEFARDGEPTESPVSLPQQQRRIDPARNMRRYYRLGIEPDLFVGVLLMKEMGAHRYPLERRRRACRQKHTAKKERRGYKSPRS